MLRPDRPKAARAIAGLTAITLITGVCLMFFHGCAGQNGADKIKDGSVTELESLLLRLSGMRVTEEYEMTANGDETTLSYYTISYANGEDERILESRVSLDTRSVIDALNGFGFIKWDGFHGKHPKGVLDGTMFSLEAVVNGGKKLTADGSANFPKRFGEFRSWLSDSLRGAETEPSS